MAFFDSFKRGKPAEPPEFTSSPLPKEPEGWIEVRETAVYRWQPYREKSNERKRGVTGRWQRLNDYGGWDNADPPAGPWRRHENKES